MFWLQVQCWFGQRSYYIDFEPLFWHTLPGWSSPNSEFFWWLHMGIRARATSWQWMILFSTTSLQVGPWDINHGFQVEFAGCSESYWTPDASSVYIIWREDSIAQLQQWRIQKKSIEPPAMAHHIWPRWRFGSPHPLTACKLPCAPLR